MKNKPIYPYNLERIENAYDPEHDLHGGRNCMNTIQVNYIDYILYQHVKYLVAKIEQLESKIMSLDNEMDYHHG